MTMRTDNTGRSARYTAYLDANCWRTCDRFDVMLLLTKIQTPYTRLTRLEDHRVWEIFFEPNSPDQIEAIVKDFRLNSHASVYIIPQPLDKDACLPGEFMLAFLIHDGSADRLLGI